MSESAAPPTSFFCGMGNVGQGLAMALQARGWPVLGAWNRGAARAAQAAQALGVSVQQGAAPVVPNCDIVWITVSDDAIAPLGQALAAQGLPRGAVAVHVSGCLPAAALGPLPVPCGSLHPLLACPTPERARDALGQGAFFALQGDAAALSILQRVVHALHGEHAVLAAAAKPRYHAAAVLASNLMVALLDLAQAEAHGAGLEQVAPHLARFAQGAVDNAAALGTVHGLTGPALRGDVRTLQAHLSALSPAGQEIYRVLSERALEMATQRGLAPEALAAAQQALGREH